LGCESSDNGDSPLSNEEKIIGNWEGYLMIHAGSGEPSSFEPGEKIMEFKPGGMLVLTEFGYISYLTYIISGDIIETRRENGTVFVRYRIVQLDSQELTLDLMDGRIWHYRRM